MVLAPAVTVQNLHVRLGRTEVLQGVDLEVQAGDLYGLLGRNGAGKTTSMRCMLGFLAYHRGSCSVFGAPKRQVYLASSAIGVALDPPGLDDTLTVRQNLELARLRGGIKGGRGVDEVLDLVGLSHRANNYGDRLSHGQGRRAAVARALLGTPQLLILDEPLSGLDPQGVEVLLSLFRRLAHEEGVTVLLSSHHLREVQDVCTRVGMIESGRTVLEGKVTELLQEAGDRVRLHCRKVDVARTLLQGLAKVRDLQLSPGGLLLQVTPDLDLEPLVKQLVEADVGLQEVVRERASLVDVFQAALQPSELQGSPPSVVDGAPA
jgi:ABC-type multidrug transport system ATPase subunit